MCVRSGGGDDEHVVGNRFADAVGQERGACFGLACEALGGAGDLVEFDAGQVTDGVDVGGSERERRVRER
ncbi:Uncharacterised protein [Mycobacteroides abscessus subsp. abscessus]|nr:Uncharacterised protein [Mycobacteroides abscessus subsp. abscessus]